MKVGDTRATSRGRWARSSCARTRDKPIIFVAGATGFAPVKSMVEHAFHVGMKRRMVLYWGVRSLADLYLPRAAASSGRREHPNFTFVPVLSDAAPGGRWTGRTGLVHEAILADFPTSPATRSTPAAR